MRTRTIAAAALSAIAAPPLAARADIIFSDTEFPTSNWGV
jgi:hypothetical protein